MPAVGTSIIVQNEEKLYNDKLERAINIYNVTFAGIEVSIYNWSNALIYATTNNYKGLYFLQSGDRTPITVTELVQHKGFIIEPINDKYDKVLARLTTEQYGTSIGIRLLYI